MPNIIKTTNDLLKDLNGGKEEGPWVIVPGYQSITQSELLQNEIKATDRSIATVSFFNNETAELRFYIAKYTDKDASEKLS